jgi:lysine 6-dehydrogenase
VTTVLLVGAGAVGARAVRQLADTPGVGGVLVADRRAERAEAVAAAMGERVRPVEWTPADAVPEGVGAVACALPAGDDLRVASRALASGVPMASVADGHRGLGALLALGPDARAADVTIVAGCGLAPGLADVLARHAASALDEVDEVRVARSGAAGPASLASLRHELRERPVEWRDAAWREERRRGGHELVWFPEPIGAQACELVAGGVSLLVDAFPALSRASVRLGEAPSRGLGRGPLRRRSEEGSWGGARVEVWGRRGRAREALVYGVIERMSIAAGTVLAVTAAQLAGALPLGAVLPPGVYGLGALAEPVAFLAELARRGVRAAVFEGVAVA